MRMAFWFVVVCGTLVGAMWLAHTMGWVDIFHWARVLQDMFSVRKLEITI